MKKNKKFYLYIYMEIKYIFAIILVILIVILFYKNNENLTPLESVLNVAKIYADASGTAIFNNVRSNNINTDKITTKEFNISSSSTSTFPINGLLDVSGNARISKKLDVSGNLGVSGLSRIDSTMIVDKLCFKDGTCLEPNTDGFIGINIYKRDRDNKHRGVTIGTDGNGNGTRGNALGASVGWIRNDNPWAGSTTPDFVMHADPYT